MSVPESVFEEEDGDDASTSEVEDMVPGLTSREMSQRPGTETSIPESVNDLGRISRNNNRQSSFVSLVDSIRSELPASRSLLQQQQVCMAARVGEHQVPGYVVGFLGHYLLTLCRCSAGSCIIA